MEGPRRLILRQTRRQANCNIQNCNKGFIEEQVVEVKTLSKSMWCQHK